MNCHTLSVAFLPCRSQIFELAIRDELDGKNPDHPIRQKLHEYIYRYMTKRLQSAQVTFLNYGYEEDPPLNLSLDEVDRPNRLGINLYHKTATQIDLAGKDVLEVSCGHGGGASYLMRTVHPGSLTASDRNGAAIKLCKKKHRISGLSFVRADARKLPFASESFDAVVNIEASHGYPGIERFFAEVVRVLRHGGYFLYADIRNRDKIPMWEEALAAAKMRPVSEREINDQVVRSLRKNSSGINDMINRQMPADLREVYRKLAGAEGTQFYQKLASGEAVYRIYCFEKC